MLFVGHTVTKRFVCAPDRCPPKVEATRSNRVGCTNNIDARSRLSADNQKQSSSQTHQEDGVTTQARRGAA